MVENAGGVHAPMGGHHKAKNWGRPDTVDTNESSPMVAIISFASLSRIRRHCVDSKFRTFGVLVSPKWILSLVEDGDNGEGNADVMSI